MDMQHLEYLLTIAKVGSINKAGSIINYPSQKLYRLIDNIEQEYSIQIFQRSTKGVLLTEEGKLFLDKMQEIYLLNKEAKNIHLLKKQNASSLLGTLRISAMPAIGDDYYAHLIPKFCQLYPNIVMHFQEEKYHKILADLSDGLIDAGIVCRISPFEDDTSDLPSNLKFLPVYKRKPHVLFAENSEFAKIYKTTTLKNLLNYSLIVYQAYPVEDSAAYRLLSHYGSVKVRASTSNLEIFYKMLSHDMGYAISPGYRSTFLPVDKSLTAIPIRDSAEYVLGILINTAGADNVLTRTFCEFYLHHHQELGLEYKISPFSPKN